jgi:hypothetical protein
LSGLRLLPLAELPAETAMLSGLDDWLGPVLVEVNDPRRYRQVNDLKQLLVLVGGRSSDSCSGTPGQILIDSL